jgi:hypothetical protein
VNLVTEIETGSMFRSEKSAKFALLGLMAFFAVALPLLYLQASYPQVCLILGIELVLYWGFLNPWILRRKYSLFFPIDKNQMAHNSFLIVGAIVMVGATILISLE